MKRDFKIRKANWAVHPAARTRSVAEQALDALNAGTLSFTDHARERMKERGVSAEDFKSVLTFGRSDFDTTTGTWHVVGSFYYVVVRKVTTVKGDTTWLVVTVVPT